MDFDLWKSHIAAAKRHYSLQHNERSQLESLGFDEFEVEEDARPDLSCPYSYEDHEVTSLFTHLEEDHSFEPKVAACPICSVKIPGDLLNHISLQHGHLFKFHRRRRSRSTATSGSQALLFERNLREAHLQVLLGNGGSRSGSNNSSTVLDDSLLSSLVLNVPASEVEETSESSNHDGEYTCLRRVTPSRTSKLSLDSSLGYEEREHRLRQATIRATFMQDLLLSTLFDD